MKKRIIKSNGFIAIATICILLSVAIIPVTLAVNIDHIEGFDKGPSYTKVVPIKKTTLVQFDKDTILDDYAYLAAVPTAVFNQDGKLFSHPLLFYEDEYPVEDDKERSLNARQGLDYFMEDWMIYCNGELDQMTLINVDEDDVKQWKADEYITIKDDDPYQIAKEIALQDWSYSDDAVVAVIDKDFKEPDGVTSSTVEGTIPGGKEVIEKTFFTNQLDKFNPRFHEFEVPEGYKYLKSRTWWACFEVGTPSDSALPIGIHVAIPTADPDSQLFCKYNGEWLQAAVTQGWNIGGMDKERAETYVYKSGSWRLSITDVPTHSSRFVERYGRLLDILRNMIMGVTYQTDITMFPGVELEILDKPPFGCRDAEFKLTWDDPGVNLGFSLIGPSGEEVLSSAEEDSSSQELNLSLLGECLPGESYSICVFALDEISGSVDFEVEYSWKQKYPKEEADALSSATEGAVLASALNAPLLYTPSSKLSEATEDIIYKLGVKNVYLVDLGGHLPKDVREEINNIAKIKEDYLDYEEIYNAIRDLTGENDIIFSTFDPWTQWFVIDKKPADETEAGLFIGPAAYCAAHHGSPVLIVDNHPEFSSAIVWHNEFWNRYASGFRHPSVAAMYLTGKRVYDFLAELGFDKEGMESMITVADQFEIGATWDRTFAGKAKPGRIFGTPVDTAYWISRNVFYPALIFNNPALDPDGVTLIQGSKSERRELLPWGQFGLKIIKPSQEEQFKYPVLQMYINPKHHLNEMFKKYYGFEYNSADDIIPGITPSYEPIDEGVVPGKEGAIWPDIAVSEVIPFYLEKGGYDNVFSTSFSAVTNDLNKGTILWFSATHGTSANGGVMLTWEPNENAFSYLPDFLSNRFASQKETNPWRGYDWYLGSTENPDTLTMEVHGFLPAFLGNPDLSGLFPTGEDFWPSERPIVNALAKIPILKWFLPKGWRDNTLYKDGMIGAHSIAKLATSGESMTGYNLDDALENIYSCGWINVACLPAYKYLHLTMIRHGSSFQVIDPWSTSWYGSFWLQSIARDIVLGDTIGEAFTKGISHVGILYLTDPPQWWWDINNNVCFFGDPDLRVFVPDTTYSDDNYWEREDTKPLRYDSELNLDGHMPYGAKEYPHAKTPTTFWQQYLWVIIALVVIVILVIAMMFIGRRKK